MFDSHRHLPRRRTTMLCVAALVSIVTLGPAPAANAEPSAARAHRVTDARSLLAAVQGGELLGTPPLPDLAAGAGATLSSPEFWANWTHELMRNNQALLPLPTDVVKPDVFLPHARVDAGVTTPLPLGKAPVDVQKITYRWAGKTKTIADFLRDTNTDALLFAHNGKLLSQAYANGYSPAQSHHAWSMTKSYISTLVGIADDEGRIRSLDDPIERYVPQLKDTAWKGTTIRNLLLMRSGMKWDEHTEEISENSQFVQWIDLALDYYSGGKSGKTRDESLRDMPRVGPQGTTFNYNSANPQVLGWMLESIYRRPLNEILSVKLWKPLGMESHADMMTDRTGDVLGSMSLQARPRDYLRFGELMRNDGRAPNGRQIVSADWVHQATTGMKPAHDAGDAEESGYGFQWWSGATPRGFQANGFQGQYTTVVPEQCVTGVRLAHTLQLSKDGEFGGQGNDEWKTALRAVASRLGSRR